MKTLKKTLALVLVLVMVLGLCATGASAYTASFKDYTDATDASTSPYAEAIDTMIGIGVINGMNDTTIGLDGKLTRAQAVKIIAYLALGQKTADKLNGTADFNDVPSGEWYAGYLAYCVSENVIAGYGDGNFGPNDELTGYQFAKMLLSALGYGLTTYYQDGAGSQEQTVNRYTGADWALYVSVDGSKLDLFDILDDQGVDLNATIGRAEAMQMAFNALRMPAPAEEDASGTPVANKMTGTDGKTSRPFYYKSRTNEVDNLTEDYDTDEYGFYGRYWNYENDDITDCYASDVIVATYTGKVKDEDLGNDLYSLTGKSSSKYNLADEVEVYVNNVKINFTAPATVDNIAGGDIGSKAEGEVFYDVIMNAVFGDGYTKLPAGAKMYLVTNEDLNGNDKDIYKIVINTYALAYVESVDTETKWKDKEDDIFATNDEYDEDDLFTQVEITFNDETFYVDAADYAVDLKEGNYYTVVPNFGAESDELLFAEVNEPTTVTGELTATGDGFVRVDGTKYNTTAKTTYTFSATAPDLTGQYGEDAQVYDDGNLDGALLDQNTGDSYVFYLDPANNVIGASSYDAASTNNYAYVELISVDYTGNTVTDDNTKASAQAKLVFTDGTTKAVDLEMGTVTVDKVDYYYVAGYKYAMYDGTNGDNAVPTTYEELSKVRVNNKELGKKAGSGYIYAGNENSTEANLDWDENTYDVNSFVTYKVNSDGTYSLKSIGYDNDNGTTDPNNRAKNYYYVEYDADLSIDKDAASRTALANGGVDSGMSVNGSTTFALIDTDYAVKSYADYTTFEDIDETNIDVLEVFNGTNVKAFYGFDADNEDSDDHVVAMFSELSEVRDGDQFATFFIDGKERELNVSDVDDFETAAKKTLWILDITGEDVERATFAADYDGVDIGDGKYNYAGIFDYGKVTKVDGTSYFEINTVDEPTEVIGYDFGDYDDGVFVYDVTSGIKEATCPKKNDYVVTYVDQGKDGKDDSKLYVFILDDEDYDKVVSWIGSLVD